MTKGLKFIKLITIIPLIYFFIFICVSNIFAGNQTWTSGGPTSGNEMDLTVGKNNIYVSGYNGIWKSENKGLSWVEKNNGIPTPHDVNNIEVDFNNDNVVFAGTWNQGLYKSEDGGNSWVKVNSFPGNYIRKLKIDPSDGNILYVGTGSGSQPGTIYKTINGGNSWQELNLGTKGIIAYITIEPANRQVITAGIINTASPGRYKSEDSGITWIRFSNESTIDFPDYPTPNPQVYYKIINNKLYISLDKGVSWLPTNDSNLPNNFQIRYLTINHTNANIIFLFSIQSGVYESKDAGYSWNPINNGLFGNFNLSLFQDLYIDKNNPATLYITTGGRGVWQYTLFEIIPTPTLSPSPSPSPTPTPLQPLVLLPGLGASWNHKNMILRIDKPQSDWYMTPGIKVYDGLIETFKNAGYKTGGDDKNLFIFNYNWTKPVSLISDDLKNYIQNVIKPPSGTKIDLVGHSLGGLVARTYVQNNQDNPVDQLLTLGSPHRGIPSIYYLWEGGNLNKALSGWQRIGAGLLVHLRKPGFSTTMETLRSVVPGLKDLLPTFNYLKQDSQEKSLNQMSQKNDWLIGLNNSLPDHLISLANNFVGILPNSTTRWIIVNNRDWLETLLGLWPDGKPINEGFGNGDQTVLAESAALTEAKIFNLENINHTDLVTSITGQQKIMEVLNLSPSSISTLSANINYESALVFQVASPATLSIADAGGNPVGYGDGKLMIVPNAQPGEYQVELTGTATGQYNLYIGQITNNKDFWTTTSGSINNGGEIGYRINFDPSSPKEDPIIDQTGESHLKSAQNKLLELKDYIAQQNIPKPTKRTLLSHLNHSIRLLNKGKVEDSIISGYRLRHQLNLWSMNGKLNEQDNRYLKNKIQEIINDLEQVYIIIITNKGGTYNPTKLVQEINLAQGDFNRMENKLKSLANQGRAKPDYGILYSLALEKLNRAKSSQSYEVHINALGARSLSQEGLFFFK